MKQDNKYPNLWIAEEGYTFIHKDSGEDIGDGICLGLNDDINNYKEVEYDNKA